MTTRYLEPVYPARQKSFYGKALVLSSDSGDKYLKSYDTIVCSIVDGKVHRYWGSRSNTTTRHLRSFLSPAQYDEYRAANVEVCPVSY